MTSYPRLPPTGSRLRRQDRDAGLDDRAEAEPLIKPAWAAIARGADPDIRRSIGAGGDRAGGERTAEPGASALGTHEHLSDLAAAIVRLHLSEPRWAALLHRRDHAHIGEFSHIAGLYMEGLGLRVLAEVLPMPYVAEFTHRVVVHLDTSSP